MIAVVGLGILGTRVVKLIDPYTELLLIDYDFVQPENVPKQYPKEALHKSKVEACRELYHEKAEVIHTHIDVTTVGVLSDCELVIDCTDNILVRRIINDFCSKEGIPWIHSALSDTAGSVAVFIPGEACFNCVYPDIVGETCSPRLPVKLADKTASAVITAMKNMTPAFIRIAKDNTVLAISKRADCKTCSGIYEWLKPKKFYITYCENAECMAAKPFKHLHDHGKPKNIVVDDMPLELFPNGEIHFHAEAEDDELYRIAEKTYKEHAAKCEAIF
jgi:molybdopterin/thiamine biosynthesis adenylyltransferase